MLYVKTFNKVNTSYLTKYFWICHFSLHITKLKKGFKASLHTPLPFIVNEDARVTLMTTFILILITYVIRQFRSRSTPQINKIIKRDFYVKFDDGRTYLDMVVSTALSSCTKNSDIYYTLG